MWEREYVPTIVELSTSPDGVWEFFGSCVDHLGNSTFITHCSPPPRGSWESNKPRNFSFRFLFITTNFSVGVARTAEKVEVV